MDDGNVADLRHVITLCHSNWSVILENMFESFCIHAWHFVTIMISINLTKSQNRGFMWFYAMYITIFEVAMIFLMGNLNTRILGYADDIDMVEEIKQKRL